MGWVSQWADRFVLCALLLLAEAGLRVRVERRQCTRTNDLEAVVVLPHNDG